MDLILKLLAMAGFIASLAVLGIYVPEPTLLAVLALAAVMGVYDFFFYRPKRANNRRT